MRGKMFEHRAFLICMRDIVLPVRARLLQVSSSVWLFLVAVKVNISEGSQSEKDIPNPEHFLIVLGPYEKAHRSCKQVGQVETNKNQIAQAWGKCIDEKHQCEP